MPECGIGNIKIHVEVPVVLTFFALMLSDSVLTNLVIYRTCYISLGYNKTDCALLGTKYTDNKTATLEKLVEPHANVIKLAQSVMEQVTAVFICLFVGPWSDRFGRKVILVLPPLGLLMNFVLLGVFAAIPNVSPWFLLLCVVPWILTGGLVTHLTAVLSYIADVTTEANRGLRMGSFEAAISIGITLGDICSSYMLYSTSYSTVFLISGLCCLLALIFTIFYIPESLTHRETEGKVRGFFQTSNVKAMFKTTFKVRRDFERCIVIFCIISLSLDMAAIMGDATVMFLYLREKFHWSLEKFTLFSAGYNVILIFGTLIGIFVLHKMLNIPETIMILIGFISALNGSLMLGLASKDYTIYASAFIRFLSGPLTPMIRSLISKVVPNEDVATIFSLTLAGETLFSLAATSGYIAIYNSTININPSICIFVTAGISLIEVLIAIALIVMRNKQARDLPYDELVNESNDQRIESETDIPSLNQSD